jgi:hypothetical protein
MTLERQDKDLFIEQPSFKASPEAPDLDILSLPAKSTKLILDYLTDVLSPTVSFIFNSIKITVCALDED